MASLLRAHRLRPPTVAHGDGGERVARVAARLGRELKVKVAAALGDALRQGTGGRQGAGMSGARKRNIWMSAG